MSSKKIAPVPGPPTEATRIKQMRDWIAEAERDGTPSDEMVLRLTVRDASALKRNPTVAVHEITFSAGVMRFLGVRVEDGGVVTSMLERAEVAPT